MPYTITHPTIPEYVGNETLDGVSGPSSPVEYGTLSHNYETGTLTIDLFMPEEMYEDGMWNDGTVCGGLVCGGMVCGGRVCGGRMCCGGMVCEETVSGVMLSGADTRKGGLV